MKITRTKNAARNILFDGILKGVNIVVPFIMRSIMLHYLGVEYLGLSGLFRSLLQFLNLAELGVGSAMVYSMYRPIAEDDTETICALMRLYRLFYRVIGLFIAVVGLSLTPLLHNLVKGELPPDVNLYILYFLNLGSTVLTYWLFAYKNSLLYAHQRNDVFSRISLALRLPEYLLKIGALIWFRNYYLYLIIQLVVQVLINIVTALRVGRMYPDYSPRGKMPKEKIRDIVNRVRYLFTAKFAGVIFDSADTLVISSFLGLKSLALYQNYFFVITSLKGMLEVVISACTAGIGNSLITESMDKNYRDLRRLTLLFGWLLSVSTAMMMCIYQPFMTIWMGEENLLPVSYVVCFSVYFYCTGMNRLVNMFKDAAGMWKRDRFRPLTAALVNLTLNLITVRWLGLYGVLLSTVISIVVVEIPWLIHNLFLELFPREYQWQYLRIFLSLALVAASGTALSWFICSLFSAGVWTRPFLNGIISFAVPNIIFLALYGRNQDFRSVVAQLLRTILSSFIPPNTFPR